MKHWIKAAASDSRLDDETVMVMASLGIVRIAQNSADGTVTATDDGIGIVLGRLKDVLDERRTTDAEFRRTLTKGNVSLLREIAATIPDEVMEFIEGKVESKLDVVANMMRNDAANDHEAV